MSWADYRGVEKLLFVWSGINFFWWVSSFVLAVGRDVDLNPFFSGGGELLFDAFIWFFGLFVIALIHRIVVEENEMKNDEKGQAARDFLITYGWATLVVIVLVGALAYFGVFTIPNPLLSADNPVRCGPVGGEDYNKCMNGVLAVQAQQVCGDLLELDKDVYTDNIIGYVAKPSLQKDIDALETGDAVIIELDEPSKMKWWELDINERDERVLHSVQCRTTALACPRLCDVDSDDGCFCYALELKTKVSGEELGFMLAELDYGVMVDE